MDSIFEHQGSGSGDRRSNSLDRRPDPWCQEQNEDDLTVRCDGRGFKASRNLNSDVVGQACPSAPTRKPMLADTLIVVTTIAINRARHLILMISQEGQIDLGIRSILEKV